MRVNKGYSKFMLQIYVAESYLLALSGFLLYGWPTQLDCNEHKYWG